MTRQDIDLGLHPTFALNALTSSLQHTRQHDLAAQYKEPTDVALSELKRLQEQDVSLKGVQRMARSRDNRYYYDTNGILRTQKNQFVIPIKL